MLSIEMLFLRDNLWKTSIWGVLAVIGWRKSRMCNFFCLFTCGTVFQKWWYFQLVVVVHLVMGNDTFVEFVLFFQFNPHEQ